MKTLEKIQIGGVFGYTHIRNGKIIDEWDEHNLLPLAARNFVNDSLFGLVAPVNPLFIGLFSNSYSPQNDDLYTHIGSRYTELTSEYDEVSRVLFEPGPSVNGVLSNSAKRALFTFNAPASVAGGMLVSNATKGDSAAASAIMLAGSRHPITRDMQTLDELLVSYVFTTTST